MSRHFILSRGMRDSREQKIRRENLSRLRQQCSRLRQERPCFSTPRDATSMLPTLSEMGPTASMAQATVDVPSMARPPTQQRTFRIAKWATRIVMPKTMVGRRPRASLISVAPTRICCEVQYSVTLSLLRLDHWPGTVAKTYATNGLSST